MKSHLSLRDLNKKIFYSTRLTNYVWKLFKCKLNGKLNIFQLNTILYLPTCKIPFFCNEVSAGVCRAENSDRKIKTSRTKGQTEKNDRVLLGKAP